MFNKRLRELRLERKMSQEELAKKLNISRQAIANWETERGEPSISFLLQLAEFFNVSMDYLCGYTDIKVSYYKYKKLCRYINKCVELYDEFLE